jgi:phage protein D
MGTARRVDLQVCIDGADATVWVNRYLKTCVYTDNEEDKADDLQLTLDDREGVWTDGWLPEKGAAISCVATQRDWSSDGTSRILDCGTFEVDTLDASGFSSGAEVSIKATSLPYSSSLRSAEKTKAWEQISLSSIANEIAANNGLSVLFESGYDPFYTRREQVQKSDIVFLQGLCKDAGISLKATAKMLVLFDEEKFEALPAVCIIAKGSSDYESYRFSSSTGDVSYGKCHVSYTDPATGKTTEYTYTTEDGDTGNDTQILEINEKVGSRDEAKKLAMKRLRQKNKQEFSAGFTMAGDVRLVAGVNVEVKGWGIFDGKYIIESAAHNFTGGYTVGLKLRRVLEGY